MFKRETAIDLRDQTAIVEHSCPGCPGCSLDADCDAQRLEADCLEGWYGDFDLDSPNEHCDV